MDNATLLQQLRTPLSEARAHWHQAMRLVMSVRSDGDVDWTSADLGVDDTPVRPEEWQAWLRTEPAHVWLMISLLEYENPPPGQPSYAELLDFVLDEVPSLAWRVLRAQDNPLRKAIDDARGARLGRACAGRGGGSWDQLGDELLGGWLEGRLALTDKISPYSLRELNLRAEAIDGALAAVYPALALKVLKEARKGDTGSLGLRADWLDAEGIRAILKAVRGKGPNLEVVLATLVEQGEPQGLEAIAELLTDKKVGDSALFWLACAGHRGLESARRALAGAKGAKGRLAEAQLERLEALPLGNPRTSGPRFRLASDLSPWVPGAQPPMEGDSEPALTRETLCAMCTGWGAPKATRSDLSPAQWADYLQVASMDDNLTHVGPSWDRARELGWLGRGAAPQSLLAAARRMNPKGRTHWNRDAKIGWGHLFLWAGADLETYAAAAALALRNAGLRRTMGWMEEHWLQPLKQVSPAWRGQVEDWLDRISQGLPTLGPVDERPAGEQVSWDARLHALQGVIPAGGVARFTLGAQGVEVEPAIGRMSLEGPVTGERRFPPTARPLPVSVTLSDDGLLFGFGSVSWGELKGAPGSCSAEGLTEVALRREIQPMWWALKRLVLDDARGAAWLAEAGGPEAARLLALVALLRPELQRAAVDAALGQLGDAAAPYLALLGREVEAPTLPMRSFAEVEAALEAHYGQPLIRQEGWTWAKGHGTRRGGFEGPALHLLEDARLPAARALLELCEGCPIAPWGGPPERPEGREVIGLRELTWTLVPPDGGFGNGPLFYQLHAAAWPVQGGVALAMWSGYDVATPSWLFGVPFLPVGGWRAT